MVAGAATFAFGVTLCETGLGCVIGAPLVVIGADVAGSGGSQFAHGTPQPTVGGAVFGPTVQLIEEEIVGAAGIAGPAAEGYAMWRTGKSVFSKAPTPRAVVQASKAEATPAVSNPGSLEIQPASGRITGSDPVSSSSAKGSGSSSSAFRAPATRHYLRKVKQRSPARDLNTVIEPGVDVAGDVSAINKGLAKRVGQTFEINGRVYGVKHNGTLFPISGPGLHPLNRGAYQALGVLNKFGDTPAAKEILLKMKNVGPSEFDAALKAWKAAQ